MLCFVQNACLFLAVVEELSALLWHFADFEAHPWTDQAHVFYDEYGTKAGGIADTGRSSHTV